ncbi:MAG: hypothetical protein M3O70_13925 [Actinomycetota bacterium]|nr:hypothetical protein [Actinomycetota bacterium]
MFVLIGSFAWGYFVTDVNVLDRVLERIWDPLDDVVFVLIALSGVYLLAQAVVSRPSPRREGTRQWAEPSER